MITVIAPHGRRVFTPNLLANFERQRLLGARLLVVENGEAIGSTPAHAATVVQSTAHQSDAMNAGLAWLRGNGGGPWARFDDDDYYGPDYLTEVVGSLAGEGTVVSGMPWRFVLFDDGLHCFVGAGEFTGGTLAANTADVPDFPPILGEDLAWCRQLRRSGARIVQRGPWGYCYDRTTRAAPRAARGGQAVTRYAFGAALFYGPQDRAAVDRPDIKPIGLKSPPSAAEVVLEVSSQ